MKCDSPYYVVPKGAVQSVPVPCGRCPPCKKRRVDSWVFRLMQEDRVSTSAHFITLTYDTDHVPISPNGFMTLDKGEFPRFMKRLRKLTNNTLKYYCCGEYGSKNKRPHYHAIVFNVPDDSLFYDAWHLEGVPIGAVHVGQVSGDSVAYTMKYIDKSTWKASHGRDDRVPEFALMSKGLGVSYAESKDVVNWHLTDWTRMYCVKDGGHKIAMPRYYRERIYADDDNGFQRAVVQAAVCEQDRKIYEDFVRLYGNNPNADFDSYLDDLKMGRFKMFYSNQKSRL